MERDAKGRGDGAASQRPILANGSHIPQRLSRRDGNDCMDKRI